MKDAPIQFTSENQLKSFLFENYLNQIKNFFRDEKQAMRFLSAVMADVQRNRKLLECTPISIVNSYITMAQFGFLPSGVSGEAYVLPYANNRKVGEKWEKVMEAQFQLGYQGLATLFYKAGVEKITSGIVREKDKTTFINGELRHEVDHTLSRDERGKVVGAYVIITYKGKEIPKYMNWKDILEHGKRFSKSYDPKGKFSPWNPDNDPEGWMGIKTVLKQAAKLVPKNETINQAIAEDNKDSVISDRLESAEKLSSGLKMGSILKSNDEAKEAKKPEEGKDEVPLAEGNADAVEEGGPF